MAFLLATSQCGAVLCCIQSQFPSHNLHNRRNSASRQAKVSPSNQHPTMNTQIASILAPNSINTYHPDKHGCPLPCNDVSNVHGWVAYHSAKPLKDCHEPMLLSLSATQLLFDALRKVVIQNIEVFITKFMGYTVGKGTLASAVHGGLLKLHGGIIVAWMWRCHPSFLVSISSQTKLAGQGPQRRNFPRTTQH